MYSVLVAAALTSPVGHHNDLGSAYYPPGGYGCYGYFGCAATWQNTGAWNNYDPLTVINYGCFSSCYGGYYGCTGHQQNWGYHGGWGACHGGNGGAGSFGPRVLYRMPGPITPYGATPVSTMGTEKMMPMAETMNKTTASRGQTVQVKNRARLVVEIPEGVDLFVDDQMTRSKSARRTFRTPELKKGQTYFYELRATVTENGRKITRSTKVDLKAGEQINTSFAGWPILEEEVSPASTR